MIQAIKTYPNKTSFKANNFEYEVESLLEEVDKKYQKSGEAHVKTLLFNTQEASRLEAARALVRGGHFGRIEGYFNDISERGFTAMNESITRCISYNLYELGKTNKRIESYFQRLIKSPHIAKSIKNILSTRL